MARQAGDGQMIAYRVTRFLSVVLVLALLSSLPGCNAKQRRDHRRLNNVRTGNNHVPMIKDPRSVGGDMPRDPPPCACNPCQNGGRCVPDGESFMCHCEAGHFGRQCDDADPCWSSPCQRRGRCIPQGSGYKCDCQPNTMGENCQDVRPTACQKDYCLHGGLCQVLTDGASSCSCVAGYFGHRCQLTDAVEGNATGVLSTGRRNRRQYDRSVYDVLMLDMAVIGSMCAAFGFFLCAYSVCSCKQCEPVKFDGGEAQTSCNNGAACYQDAIEKPVSLYVSEPSQVNSRSVIR